MPGLFRPSCLAQPHLQIVQNKFQKIAKEILKNKQTSHDYQNLKKKRDQYIILMFYVCCCQVWATYSPVKNSPGDARTKGSEGNPTHSATTAEMDMYKCNCDMLMRLTQADAGGSPVPGQYNGIAVEEWPRVVLNPSFAACLEDIKVGGRA
jgi:hypothetical protein